MRRLSLAIMKRLWFLDKKVFFNEDFLSNHENNLKNKHWN